MLDILNSFSIRRYFSQMYTHNFAYIDCTCDCVWELVWSTIHDALLTIHNVYSDHVAAMTDGSQHARNDGLV